MATCRLLGLHNTWFETATAVCFVAIPAERGGGAPREGRRAAEGCPGLCQAGGPVHPQGPGGDGGSLREDEECQETPAAHKLLVRFLVSLSPFNTVFPSDSTCIGTCSV